VALEAVEVMVVVVVVVVTVGHNSFKSVFVFCLFRIENEQNK